jgi:hypothetical protein
LKENYTTHTHRQESPPKEDEHKEKERKHEHYWELALRKLIEALGERLPERFHT